VVRIHRTDVIDAIRVRHELAVIDVLADFFNRAVQVPDVGRHETQTSPSVTTRGAARRASRDGAGPSRAPFLGVHPAFVVGDFGFQQTFGDQWHGYFFHEAELLGAWPSLLFAILVACANGVGEELIFAQRRTPW